MTVRHTALMLAALAAAATAQDPPRAIQVTEPPAPLKLAGQDIVRSDTGQFRISGGEPADRANAAMLAEQAKRELLALTEDPKQELSKRDDDKVPVAVYLHGKPGDPTPLRTIITGIRYSEVGFAITLDVHLSRGIETERFKQAVTSALVYERTLRDIPAGETDVPFLVPPWLPEGLREANAWRLNESDRRLYEALFKTGGLYKIDQIFSMTEAEHNNLDGAMRSAFRVSCGALVMALLEQPQGRPAFRAFLKDVAGFQGEMPTLLRKHFPELNLSETSLSKWWALQMANIGGQNLATDILPVSKTEAALAEALRLNFRNPEGILQQKEISAWQEVAPLPPTERTDSTLLAQDALVRLSYRCFPSYRPIISEYQAILQSIAAGKTDDIAQRLTDLATRRTTMAAKAEHARDYLIWFEITRARKDSGDFEDYLHLKESLKDNPTRRDDSISRYLDRMDALFNRGLEAAPEEMPSMEMDTSGPFGDLPPPPDVLPDLPPLPQPAE
ncbi:MAG: hypothetical protein EOP88_24805 [Verrucomicrobiaceae bacterium]|nr:MAG: hypothetical protein EOP88_24805 [Verrucomicrobiaceae bacterium]